MRTVLIVAMALLAAPLVLVAPTAAADHSCPPEWTCCHTTDVKCRVTQLLDPCYRNGEYIC